MSEAMSLANAWGSAITAREHVKAGNDMSMELIRLARVEAEAEAAVKQARIDALEEAKQAVSAEEILDAEDNADDAYNCGVLDCVRAVEKLKGTP